MRLIPLAPGVHSSQAWVDGKRDWGIVFLHNPQQSRACSMEGFARTDISDCQCGTETEDMQKTIRLWCPCWRHYRTPLRSEVHRPLSFNSINRLRSRSRLRFRRLNISQSPIGMWRRNLNRDLQNIKLRFTKYQSMIYKILIGDEDFLNHDLDAINFSWRVGGRIWFTIYKIICRNHFTKDPNFTQIINLHGNHYSYGNHNFTKPIMLRKSCSC